MALIDNDYLKKSNERIKRMKRTTLAEHNLISAPKNASGFQHKKWVTTGEETYQQYQCRDREYKKRFVHSINVDWGTGYAKIGMVNTL